MSWQVRFGLQVWRGSAGVWVVSRDWALGAGCERGLASAFRTGWAVGEVDGVQFWFSGVWWMQFSWSGAASWERVCIVSLTWRSPSVGCLGPVCALDEGWMGLVRGGVGNGGGVWWGFDCDRALDVGGDSFEVKVGLWWGSVLGSLLFMKVVDTVSWGMCGALGASECRWFRWLRVGRSWGKS